jgi:hypothetical protein
MKSVVLSQMSYIVFVFGFSFFAPVFAQKEAFAESPSLSLPMTWQDFMKMEKEIENQKSKDWRSLSLVDFNFRTKGGRALPEGLKSLHGQEFAQLFKPGSRQAFEFQFRGRRDQERPLSSQEIDEKYKEYLSGQANQVLAVLMMSRILDYEAYLEGHSFSLPTEILDYLFEALFSPSASDILSQSSEGRFAQLELSKKAIEGLSGPRSKTSQGDLAKKYEELLESVSERPFQIMVDWTFDEALAGLLLDRVKRAVPFRLLELRIQFQCSQMPGGPKVDCLPDTFEDFQEKLVEKVLAVYRSSIRQFTWQKLFQKAEPLITEKVLFSVAQDEIERAFELMFLRGPHSLRLKTQLEGTELILKGPLAKDMAIEFQKLFKQIERAIIQENIEELRELSANASDTHSDKASQFDFEKKKSELRAEVLRRSWASFQEGFEETLKSGQVQLETRDKVIYRDELLFEGLEPSRLEQAQRVFNPIFQRSVPLAPISLIENKSNEEETEIWIFVFEKEIKEERGEDEIKAFLDPQSKVYRKVREKLVEKFILTRFKHLTERLMARHLPGMKIKANICLDPEMPCMELRVSELAKSLFPMRLYEEREEKKSAVSSQRSWASPRPNEIFEISDQLLQAVFSIP